MAVHEVAARFYRDQLAGSWVPGYLAGRGFSPVVQARWQAGYAPAGPDALTSHLRAAGYAEALIEAAGLAHPTRRGLADTFRDRAVLPVRSATGSIVAFIGRAPEHSGPAAPKYLNSPATELYDKGHVLFGLWQARAALAAGAVPVIVEGPLDVMAVAAAAVGPARYAPVAPCGTALTARQVATLSQATDLRAAGVLAAFDADDAGHRAAVSAYHLLSPLTTQLAALDLPAGQDPAQILRDHGAGALASMLSRRAHPLADLVTDAEVSRWDRWLPFAEGRINALRAAAPLVAAMPPADVARQVARLASRLDLEAATVTEAVTDALTARHRQPGKLSADIPAGDPLGPQRTRASQTTGTPPPRLTWPDSASRQLERVFGYWRDRGQRSCI